MLNAAGQDVAKEKPVIERKREWEHGDRGRGQNCPESKRPIFTAPEKLPDPCRNWTCGGD